MLYYVTSIQLSKLNRVHGFLSPKLPEMISTGGAERISVMQAQDVGSPMPSVGSGVSTMFDRRLFERLLDAHYTINEILSNCTVPREIVSGSNLENAFMDEGGEECPLSFVFETDEEVHQYLIDLNHSDDIFHQVKSKEALMSHVVTLMKQMMGSRSAKSKLRSLSHLVQLSTADGSEVEASSGKALQNKDSRSLKEIMFPMVVSLLGDTGSEVWVVIALKGELNQSSGCCSVEFHLYDMNEGLQEHTKDDGTLEEVKDRLVKYSRKKMDSLFPSGDLNYNSAEVIHTADNIPSEERKSFLVWRLHRDIKKYGTHLSLLIMFLDYVGSDSDNDEIGKKCLKLIDFIEESVEKHSRSSVLNACLLYLMCTIALSSKSRKATIETGEVNSSNYIFTSNSCQHEVQRMMKYAFGCVGSKYLVFFMSLLILDEWKGSNRKVFLFY